MSQTHPVKKFEYAIIGAGPASLFAIANLIAKNIPSTDILWIDPAFMLGDFGTRLSEKGSVPGNTKAKVYRKAYAEICQLVPSCKRSEKQVFKLDEFDDETVCYIANAAEVFLDVSNKLRPLVTSKMGRATQISKRPEESDWRITVLAEEKEELFLAKRVILATGASPRKLALPKRHQSIQFIDDSVAITKQKLKEFLEKNPQAKEKPIAVIGSSHTAALVTMHLLQLGCSVKQFMNKAYKYAETVIDPDGNAATLNDNTGLKGNVAVFTKKLMADLDAGHGDFNEKITFYVGKDICHVNELLDEHLVECDYVVAAIGYEPAKTLKINNQEISHLRHNSETTQFENMDGLFGIGIAFPEKVVDISNEVALAVGVGKFADTTSNPKILNIWEKNFAGSLPNNTEDSHSVIFS